MKDSTTYMGIDQYGQIWHDLGPHPRAELMRRLGRSHVEKMYVDSESKGTLHIGYVIAGLWITLYRVDRMERAS
jgi:hypothetical protein